MTPAHFTPQRYDVLDSTNTEAFRVLEGKEAAGEPLPPTAIYALEQTAGRGTRGRNWASYTGNVHASYVFPLNPLWQNRNLLTYPLGLAVQAAVQSYVPKEKVELKWPNDVLVNGQKISGALHEIHKGQNQSYFIAGIGINIAWKPQENMLYPCAAVADYTDDAPNVDDVVRRLGEAICHFLKVWDEEGFEAIREAYLQHAFMLNRGITLSLHGGRSHSQSGVYEGIDATGALLLRKDDGVHRFTSADIFPHLKGGWLMDCSQHLETTHADTVFAMLEGVWTFKRSVNTGAESAGQAIFKNIGEGKLLYTEEGNHTTGGSFYKSYLYEQAGEAINLSHFDAHNKGERFQALRFIQAEAGLTAKGHNLCKQDTYNSHYFLNEGQLVIEHTVNGPKKAYSITTHYTKAG